MTFVRIADMAGADSLPLQPSAARRISASISSVFSGGTGSAFARLNAVVRQQFQQDSFAIISTSFF